MHNGRHLNLHSSKQEDCPCIAERDDSNHLTCHEHIASKYQPTAYGNTDLRVHFGLQVEYIGNEAMHWSRQPLHSLKYRRAMLHPYYVGCLLDAVLSLFLMHYAACMFSSSLSIRSRKGHRDIVE